MKTDTITTKDGITVRPLTPGKWEARTAPTEDATNDADALSRILEETASVTAKVARCMRPGGPPMSQRAMLGSVQEHIDEIGRLLAQLKGDVGTCSCGYVLGHDPPCGSVF